ncbi:MAG: hypothetical protein PW792_09555 [Acidobacteriaceae bacterium]|nr:hypothetical protein [Acidobacteriaceae bacterium]
MKILLEVPQKQADVGVLDMQFEAAKCTTQKKVASLGTKFISLRQFTVQKEFCEAANVPRRYSTTNMC